MTNARAVVVMVFVASASASMQAPPDTPAVTVRGKTYTPSSILARNMGSEEDQTTQFPPYKVVGNVYYIGTRTLTSFLITTSQGHIIVNTTYDRNVPVLQKSVEQLGFKFSDVRIVLGTHAHGDHQEGDARVKALTGAQVMAMAEDVPALKAIRPDNREHPVDRELHDGDTVRLGGTTLTAHLTAGHTRGCTTWTLPVQDNGRTYNVVIQCSLRAPAPVTAQVAAEFERTFKVVRALPCDVPRGDHAAQYDMATKYSKMRAGSANPFIAPNDCQLEADIQEAMFRAALATSN